MWYHHEHWSQHQCLILHYSKFLSTSFQTLCQSISSLTLIFIFSPILFLASSSFPCLSLYQKEPLSRRNVWFLSIYIFPLSAWLKGKQALSCRRFSCFLFNGELKEHLLPLHSSFSLWWLVQLFLKICLNAQGYAI